MPRRSVLTASQAAELLALPATDAERIRVYTFTPEELKLIRSRRGRSSRLGFAVTLAYMRYPGIVLGVGEQPDPGVLAIVAAQLGVDPQAWAGYARRRETRREHLVELAAKCGFQPFTAAHHRAWVTALEDIGVATEKGVVLAGELVAGLRAAKVLLPSTAVIERVCAEALTRADRRVYAALTDPLTDAHRERLDRLLTRREDTSLTWLAWLRQSPAKPNSRHMLDHIARLRAWTELDLPEEIDRVVHRNRLARIARQGAQMTPADLARFEPARRYATLVAQAVEGRATVTDEIIDLHDRIVGKMFNTARNKHGKAFTASGRAINDKVRLYARIGAALVNAKQAGTDPYAAIEKVIPWEAFVASITEATDLAQPEEFDYLHRIAENYTTLRRYTPALLEVLTLRAAPATGDLLAAIDTLRTMNANGARKLPDEAPTGFIRKRWEKLVRTAEGLDRRYYELAAMTELRNGLRSGDIWVKGSRQFKDFQDYLLPPAVFTELRDRGQLPAAVATDPDHYLDTQLQELRTQLAAVNTLAGAGGLPDAVITDKGLKITPLETVVPQPAQTLIDRTAGMLPHVKITDLLQEVDDWTGFTRHFTHMKSAEPAKDRNLLLSAVLADSINLGLTKMAESCPGTTYARLSWLAAWHIRDDTYTAALAELVNTQLAHPFAAHWGQGTTSSSDGQRYRAGNQAQATGHINPKYGGEPGRMFYTHISDQYSPFHTNVVNVGVRDSTYVLDGLLHHETDLQIQEHYTDTAGFTDHVFALMSLLGYRFAPRIRDLGDTKLYIPPGDNHDALKTMIGGTLNTKLIRTHWQEILRLATSIKQGTVTASLMLKKLGSYPRQNGLALALRELGRLHRTLFILDWLQSTELRRRVQAGLNKGEARNALARAVFYNRLGEIRDRNYDQQRHRASGLNLVTAAIVLWNTTYLHRATTTISNHDDLDPKLLPYLSPLGWEHINLTGDFIWPKRPLGPGKYRPLRQTP